MNTVSQNTPHADIRSGKFDRDRTPFCFVCIVLPSFANGENFLSSFQFICVTFLKDTIVLSKLICL